MARKTLVVYAILGIALALYVDWLAIITWTVFGFETIFEMSDKCFYLNPILKTLFNTVEDRDLDRTRKVPATLMTEIQAADYSYEALEVLSKHWTQPVVVRGLFASSPAIHKWKDAEYLIQQVFGSNETSVILNGTRAATYERFCGNKTLDQDFSKEQAFDQTLRRILAGDSSETIVFPPASRSKRYRNAPLETAFNQLVDRDLDLRRLGADFAAGAKSTVLTQMFLGGAYPEGGPLPLVGTGWHCDICNNFIVEISGVKRWIMVDPKYSAYMRPTMAAGKTAIAGAHISIMTDTLPYFPHHVVDLYPGDFLYNPEWYWHTIENQAVGPYAFGLVSRQCHVKRNFKSNSIFTTLILLNHAMASLYDPEARQRLWSAITGATLMRPEDAVHVAKNAEAAGGYTNAR